MQSNLKQQAYLHIRRKLLIEGIEPGTRLSDVELSKEIGISRTPVREAISQLESDGLVEQIPRFGAFVKRLDREDIEDIYELRELLEGQAAARAAQRINKTDAETLERHVQTMRQLAGHVREVGFEALEKEAAERWVLEDASFHILILTASGSPRMLKIVGDFRIMTRTFFPRAQDHNELIQFPRHTAKILLEHSRICQAILRHDSEAARKWMMIHIARGKERALARYESTKIAADQKAADLAMGSAPLEQLVARMEQYHKRSS